jgi:hypothetical protein
MRAPARGGSRVVVAFGKRFKGVETTDAGFGNGCFRAARNGHVDLAQANVGKGIHQRVGGRGAGRYRYEVGTTESVADGNPARTQVNDHFGNKEGVEAGCTVAVGKPDHLFLEGFEAADARTPDDAGPVQVRFFQVQGRVFQGFLRYHHGVLRERVHFAGLFLFNEVGNLKVFDFAGKPGPELLGVEFSNGGGSTYPSCQTLPVFLGIVANWSKCADSRNYYSS